MPLSKPIIFETTFSVYTGTDILGEGGGGRVYRATDNTGKECAIKLVDSAKANSERAKRFKNEVLFSLRNQHPNIITITDHGILVNSKKHSPFCVMPLYKGSLRTLLASGIPPDKVLFYFAQLLDGVEAAHLQNVFHRDLKPENVLYDEAQDRLLVADFGIAHFEEEMLYTLVETPRDKRLANFQYAAPEQRNPGAHVDHRADIYALGLILNEMFTGKVPHGTRFKTIGSVAPPYGYLDERVSEMLHQSAEDRPASIDMVKQPLIDLKIVFIRRQHLSTVKQIVEPVIDSAEPRMSTPPHLKDREKKADTHFDVCVVCALPEEAKAFMHIAEQYYLCHFVQGLSRVSSGSYFYTTIQNKEGKPLTIHLSCPIDDGPLEIALHLKPVLNEFAPRFVAMTGVCAGDKLAVRLGDLVVAERAFSLDTGKVVIDEHGLTKHLYGTATYSCTPQVLQFAKIFDAWRAETAKIRRSPSEEQEPVLPVLHIRPMASSGIIRGDNPFSQIRDIDRKAIAIDGESAIFYRTMAEFPNTHSLLVKGVTDYANSEKIESYHQYAAEASSLYALSFMKEYLTSDRLLSQSYY